MTKGYKCRWFWYWIFTGKIHPNHTLAVKNEFEKNKE